MQTVEQFIDAVGGTTSVARAMGISPSTVSSWKAAGNIPKWRVRDLATVAAEQGIAMPSEFGAASRHEAA